MRIAQHAKRLSLIALVPFAGACSDLGEPEKYPGNVDGIRFLIPREALVVPVRYEGEDDWSPSTKPRSERTFSDRLSLAEIANFELRDLPAVHDPAGTELVEPSPLGEMQVAYSFFEPHRPSFSTNISYWPELLKAPYALPGLWGLKARQSDKSNKNYNYAQDRDYKSPDGKIWIICSSNRLKIKPFTKMPDSCFMRAIDVEDRAEIQVNLPARDLVYWKQIYERSAGVLNGWRVK